MDAPLFTSLEEKVDPAHSAVIVVDVQNDFCATDGWMGKACRNLPLGEIQAMVPRLEKFIDVARAHQVPVIWVRCAYDDIYIGSNQKERVRRQEFGRPPVPVGYLGSGVLCAQAGGWRGHRDQAPLRRLRGHESGPDPPLQRNSYPPDDRGDNGMLCGVGFPSRLFSGVLHCHGGGLLWHVRPGASGRIPKDVSGLLSVWCPIPRSSGGYGECWPTTGSPPFGFPP